ncbi:hypothetical protein PG989_010625 [Apiospora arundinis]|uniref:2EXR domain-containing protein n=1 Tax=Apiospora arundinis TaxID=335852 RepID=A0ABR2HNW6_9PEZI
MGSHESANPDFGTDSDYFEETDEGSESEHELDRDDATICPHLDGPSACKVHFPYPDPSAAPSLAPEWQVKDEYNSGCLSVTPGQLKPWMYMVRDLLLEAQVPIDHIGPILQTHLPAIYHPLPLDIPLPEVDPACTFHPFSRLPTELRLKIWASAALEKPRLIHFTEEPQLFPCNGPRHVPRVAQACSEAWQCVMAQGSYWQPAHRDEEAKTTPYYWAADTDIAYLWGRRCYKPNVPFDFLASRKTVAVDYDHFIHHATWAPIPTGIGASKWLPKEYAWLRDSKTLQTVIVLLQHTEMEITGDYHTSEADCCGDVYEDIWDRYTHWSRPLWKLLIYDEDDAQAVDELDRVSLLWKTIRPDGAWVYRKMSRQSLVKGNVWDGDAQATCISCELERGREMADKARSAWLQMTSAAGDDHDYDKEEEEKEDGGAKSSMGKSQGRRSRRRVPDFQVGMIFEIQRCCID